jgi:hypothetical protein
LLLGWRNNYRTPAQKDEVSHLPRNWEFGLPP